MEASLNMNHWKGKINLYGDVSYSGVKKPFTMNAYNATHYLETYFAANRTDTTPNIYTRLGIDYELSKHTLLGLLLTGYDNRYSQSEHNNGFIKSNAFLDISIRQNNSEVNHWYNYAGNVNL